MFIQRIRINQQNLCNFYRNFCAQINTYFKIVAHIKYKSDITRIKKELLRLSLNFNLQNEKFSNKVSEIESLCNRKEVKNNYITFT